MSAERISIKGLEKYQVLQALYEDSQPLGIGFIQYYQPGPLSDEEAKTIIAQQGLSFDYIKGRVIKCNIEGDEFKFWLYDRDNGEGAAERAIDKLISRL